MAWGGVDTQMRHPEVGEGTATGNVLGGGPLGSF